MTSRIGLVESNGAVVSNVGNVSTDTDDDLRKLEVKIGESLGVWIGEVSLAVGLE